MAAIMNRYSVTILLYSLSIAIAMDNRIPPSPRNQVIGTVPAADSINADQLNQRKYAEVTIIAEELGEKDGTIQLKQLLVWNYLRLSSNNTPQQPEIRHFYMYHTRNDNTTVQLGICERGPFGPATVGGNCSAITFTGPDTNVIMSNIDGNSDTLYLRGRRRGRTVNSFYQLTDNSFFSIWIRPDGVGPHGGAICVIFVVNLPTLAFRYSDSDDVVITEPFNNSNPAFEFELVPLDQPEIEFVDDKNCITF